MQKQPFRSLGEGGFAQFPFFLYNKNNMKTISKNFMGALFILFTIALLYTAISDSFKEVPEISLSDLVKKINEGSVSKIIVRDSDLNVTYRDGSEANSKKENEAALSETFKNYGISDVALQG